MFLGDIKVVFGVEIRPTSQAGYDSIYDLSEEFYDNKEKIEAITPYSMSGVEDPIAVFGIILQDVFNFEPTEVDSEVLDFMNDEDKKNEYREIIMTWLEKVLENYEGIKVVQDEPKLLIYMHNDD